MGYQESYIRFKNKRNLRREYKKFQEIQETNEGLTLADIVCVRQAIKNAPPIQKGEFLLVGTGERSANQPGYLGLKGVHSLVPIDHYIPAASYMDMSINQYLDSHFRTLSKEEENRLLAKISCLPLRHK
ncbi:hypothetical protein [Lentibacillus salinarum]|uniref:Uncharacterized protein n=1 Tax=Lentibacillus salinarum TaxID=446820 RepID=A0ABW3ZZF6_9BACI